MIKTNLLGSEVPEEGVHYACMTCMTIDSVMKMENMNYRQVYLEECKYKMQKIKMPEYIDAKLKSYSTFGSE